MHNTAHTRLPRFIAIAAFAALALTGCATADPAIEPTPAPTHGDPGAASAAPHQHYFVTEAWVEAAESGTSAAYGVIESKSHDDVQLVEVSTPAAAATELQDASGKAIDGIDLMIEERLELAPSGPHIALLDLTAPLVAGEEVELTLTFSDGEVVTVSAKVQDAGSR